MYSKKHKNGRYISHTLFFYILKDMFLAYLVTFLFFFFVFFINQFLLIAQEILSKQVPIYQVVLLLVYALPQVVALAAPFASLMGTLITVGRLSSDSEILVILASGSSYKMVFLPALVMGLIISLLSFFTNDVLLPAGTVQFQRLYRSILVSTPALEIEANSVKRFSDTVIVTGPVVGTGISNLLILDRTGEGERRLIMAESARLTDSGMEGLSLDLNEAFYLSSRENFRNDYDYASSSFLRYWVVQEDLIQAIHSIGPNQMSSYDLGMEIQEMNLEHMDRLDERYLRVISNSLGLEESLRAGSSSELWNRRESFLGNLVREMQGAITARNNMRLQIYRTEYYIKFSIPFGALSFVLLSATIGLYAKKSGQTMGFIVGLILSVIFWALLVGGRTIGVNRNFPPMLTMWLPNILALSGGFILLFIRLKR